MSSAIYGTGYGSIHCWIKKGTAQVGSVSGDAKQTWYECKVCQVRFTHYYDVDADIFHAMKQANIAETCTTSTYDDPMES